MGALRLTCVLKIFIQNNIYREMFKWKRHSPILKWSFGGCVVLAQAYPLCQCFPNSYIVISVLVYSLAQYTTKPDALSWGRPRASGHGASRITYHRSYNDILDLDTLHSNTLNQIRRLLSNSVNRTLGMSRRDNRKYRGVNNTYAPLRPIKP